MKLAPTNICAPAIGAAAFLGAATTSSAAGTVGVVANCSNTVHAYAHARDAVDGDRFGALFSDDAILTTPSGVTQGRAAIVADMLARGAAGKTHHLVSSVHIQKKGDEGALGESYSLVFLTSPGEPLRKSDMAGIVLYRDEFVISDGRCLFKKRRLEITPFEQDAP